MVTVVFLVMATVQMALSWHARSVVSAAAQDGLRATQTETGSTAAGRAAATNILSGSRQLLISPQVNIVRSGDVAAVTVTAKTASLVPGWQPTVVGNAAGSVERFRSEDER